VKVSRSGEPEAGKNDLVQVAKLDIKYFQLVKSSAAHNLFEVAGGYIYAQLDYMTARYRKAEC